MKILMLGFCLLLVQTDAKKSRLEILMEKKSEFKSLDNEKSMIWQGEQTKPGTWPSMVAIFRLFLKIDEKNGQYIQHDQIGNQTVFPNLICTGTVLNHEQILTAAQCFFSNDVPLPKKEIQQNYLVMMGGQPISLWRELPHFVNTIRTVRIHPGYNHTKNKILNDIAIAYLTKPTNLPGVMFSPLDGPRDYNGMSLETFEPIKCIAIGFGSILTYDGMEYCPGILNQIDHPMHTGKQCANFLSKNPNYTPRKMICAGYVQWIGKTLTTPSKGDIGSPLYCIDRYLHPKDPVVTFYNALQTGILTSYDIKKYNGLKIGGISIYTNIRYYKGWINRFNTWKNPHKYD